MSTKGKRFVRLIALSLDPPTAWVYPVIGVYGVVDQ
jgi:hypothetical protein